MISEKMLDVVQTDRAIARFDQSVDSFLAGRGIGETQLQILGSPITATKKVVGMGQIPRTLIVEDLRTRGGSFRVGKIALAVTDHEVLVGCQRQLPQHLDRLAGAA